jgi:hypothetical protein
MDSLFCNIYSGVWVSLLHMSIPLSFRRPFLEGTCDTGGPVPGHLVPIWALCKGLSNITETAGSSHIIHALQSGQSVANENRIYGLSPDALLGASEDVLHLFLEARTERQAANKVVHSGLGLSHREAATDRFDSLAACGVIKSHTGKNLSKRGHGGADEAIQTSCATCHN